jgi:hypothetical protein
MRERASLGRQSVGGVTLEPEDSKVGMSVSPPCLLWNSYNYTYYVSIEFKSHASEDFSLEAASPADDIADGVDARRPWPGTDFDPSRRALWRGIPMPLDSVTLTELPSVEAELNYLVPMAERPRYYAFDPPAGTPRSNSTHEAHRVAIRDVRPIASSVALDSVGFGVVEHRSAVRDFQDEDAIRRVYYPEAERLLKDVTGADRVFIFDHTLRRRVPGAEDRGPGPRQPATRVHVDHTAKSGPQRVRDLLPDEAEELLHGRVQIINIWRPLHGPLLDAPLAVADAGSVSPRDLVPSDLVYQHRVGETYGVTYNPAQRGF